jgi:uncharacterized membrane protein YfcA
LLALGLPPVSANVTNTVALMFTAVGAAAGSRPELTGQGRRVRSLGMVTAAGGAAGAALLLLTPARGFEYAAPLLIAAGSVAMMLRPTPPDPDRADGRGGLLLHAGVFAVAIYIGYFGAAGGILMLAVLTRMFAQSLAQTIALKNVILGLANAVAGIAFAFFGPVRWSAALPLAVGFLIGGWLGPALVRRLPARTLRAVIGVGGLAVALRLGLSAYA